MKEPDPKGTRKARHRAGLEKTTFCSSFLRSLRSPTDDSAICAVTELGLETNARPFLH